MAEPIKRGERYRHSVMVGGKRHYGSFDTKKEARLWEADLVLKSKAGTLVVTKKHKLTDAVDKYLTTVSVGKRNAVTWETRRFNAFIASIDTTYVEDVTSEKLGDWRDERSKSVSPSTVAREANLIRNLFSVATKEWKWLKVNPFSGVKLPQQNPPRKAIWRWQQIKKVLRTGQRCGGKIGEVAAAFHISLHTALRLQEALVATSTYNTGRMVFVLPATKTEKFGEEVPVTRRGRAVIRRYASTEFTVSPNEASTLFSRLKRYSDIKGLEFRDARATALTMLARRVDILTLARISRHKNLELLRSTYYRETPDDISRRT